MIRLIKTLAGGAVTLLLAAGCLIVVEVPETKVRAQNDLYDLVLDVDGQESDVEAIDLNTVVIGNVVYSTIYAGEITSERVIDRSGDVDVFIGSADVTVITYLGPIGTESTFIFEDIDPMETTIDAGQLNTVVFDEITAGVIFSALAKKPKRVL